MTDDSVAAEGRDGAGPHPDEPHHDGLSTRLNWLRAAVLGANDGIVSTAGLVVGVAGATDSRSALLTAGLAGLMAGSLSMAAGEYVSVSTQRDSEQAALALEREELATTPQAELDELTGLLQDLGITHELAREVAEQLTARDALGAHARVELGIDPDELANPWHAAWASFVSFTVGALLPLLAIVLPPADWRLGVTVVSVLAALSACGLISARLGNAPVRPAVIRNVAGGAIAMAVTYAVGTLLGASGI
ncbi:VIT family protein [Streptomyces sp. NPDC049040]|uniref:VIT1/CCC1 transporter family protein n=1 Tax=Streptomyces sp. NPDC049040 TaxID=3365593 RepID=UPI00371DA98A